MRRNSTRECASDHSRLINNTALSDPLFEQREVPENNLVFSFEITPENNKRAEANVQKYQKDLDSAAVMPVLNLTQRQHGCLPISACCRFVEKTKNENMSNAVVGVNVNDVHQHEFVEALPAFLKKSVPLAVPFSNTRLRVPAGFRNILKGFTREVLRDQPDDIFAYGSTYFDRSLQINAESDCDSVEAGAKEENCMYSSDAFEKAALGAQMSSDNEAAALKVQTNYRQYDAEKTAREMRQNGTAVKIQSVFNRHQDRKFWDKRDRLNPEVYLVDGAVSRTICRLPTSINGQQFIIQNCKSCKIFVFDHMASVTIDDCSDCCIFLGPIKGSIFIRDCSDCRVMVACQQFRTRDCRNMEIFLCCSTQPIIESSSGMKFSCFQYSYSQLEDQFQKSGLSVFNNNWSDIHDFTPVPDERNYSFLPQDTLLDCFIPPSTEGIHVEGLSIDRTKSIIPHTLGKQSRQHDESCLIIFFSQGKTSSNEVRSFMKKMSEDHADCDLVQSKEVHLQPSEAENIIGTNDYKSFVTQGPVVGLEYNGENCCKICHTVTKSQHNKRIFISQDATAAKKEIENFYNVANLQLAI